MQTTKKTITSAMKIRPMRYGGGPEHVAALLGLIGMLADGFRVVCKAGNLHHSLQTIASSELRHATLMKGDFKCHYN